LRGDKRPRTDARIGGRGLKGGGGKEGKQREFENWSSYANASNLAD
jgi:hypothetical protein